MVKKLSFSRFTRLKTSSLRVAVWLLLGCAVASAGTPEWLRAAARSEMPRVTQDTSAVMLLDETFTAVNSDGDMKEVVRRAYKILRPKGQEYGRVAVYFDSETRLEYLRAWSIPPQGSEYEIKDKDKETVETTVFTEALYEDVCVRIIQIPAAVPGSVIGYEYARRHRPRVLQSVWFFQHQVPTKRARFILQLPTNWEYESYWRNYQPAHPSSSPGHQVVWELNDIPELEEEDSMPAWHSLAGSLNLAFHPMGTSRNSWREVGTSYAALAADRLQSTPEIKSKVNDLMASAGPAPQDKLKAVAGFVQQSIRYVAIEVGIGGYQPHPAAEVFRNRYGDCKDKATLLNVMLHEAGFDSYYVLVNTDRGVVAPGFPSLLSFNHVIVAIRLPEEISVGDLHAIRSHSTLGKLLFFDPTDHLNPLGYLPSSLQGTDGLMIIPAGSELLQLPVAAPSVNKLLRAANLTLAADGSLSGTVREIRSGSVAISKKASWRVMTEPERQKDVEDFVSAFLGNVKLSNVKTEGLDDVSATLILDYSFIVPNYGQIAGPLMLFRPRVLGSQAADTLEKKLRKYPVEFPHTWSYSDLVEIRIPAGYLVDDVPPAMDVSFPAADYHSKVHAEDDVVRYTRTLNMNQVQVPTERLDDMKNLYRKIADDERSTVVLKHSAR